MKYIKMLGIISIVLFSFYYTEKIANLVLISNPLYQEILDKKEKYEIKSIGAIIDGNYITPGLDGLSINVKDSYYNMKDIEVFNSYYLKYASSYPTISIEQNKDKIINKGNPYKNSIALVLEYDENIINHLKEYPLTVLTNIDNFKKNQPYEQINNEITNFKKLDTLISKYGNNKNICVINDNNKDICLENKKYLVEATHILSNNNYLELKDHIDSGDIILIKKNTNLNNIDIIIKSILYKDYTINYLSKHISEERT